MSAPSRRYTVADLPEAVTTLLEGETDLVATLANLSALLFEALPDINWLGFYLWKNGGLVLGPFQGRVACTRIAPGRGVCGTVAVRHETIVVEDVHQFEGHIACDAASASEIVVPVLVRGRLFAVLDIDSPITGRFSMQDKLLLENLVSKLAAHLARE